MRRAVSQATPVFYDARVRRTAVTAGIALLFATAVPAIARTPRPAASPEATGWTIQVASTSARAEAERLVTVLVGRDAPAFWSEAEVGGKKMYRVRVGHFRTKDEARVFAENLAPDMKLDYWIAPDDTPPAIARAATATPGATSTIEAPVRTPAPMPSASASPSAPPTPAQSAAVILAAAEAAHGGAQGGFPVLDRAASIAFRYRLKSLDPKTGEPVFTHQSYYRKGKDRLRLEIEPLEGGDGPSSVTVYTPTAAWVDAAGVRTELSPAMARARIESLGPAGVLRLPLEFPRKGAGAAGFRNATVAGPRTLNGEPVLRLDAAPPPARYREASLYVAPDTHRLAAARFLTDAGELLLTFDDYRAPRDGLLVPFHRSVYRDGTVVSSLEIDALDLDKPIDDALFTK